MEWFIAGAAVGLVAVVLVGLFMGPSHGHTAPGRRRTHGRGPGHDPGRRPAGGAEAKSGTPQPAAPAPAEPPAYTLPPAPRRRPLARRPAGRRGGRRT